MGPVRTKRGYRRVAAVLDMRKTNNATPWVFPAPTMSGHIEPSTLKKQHVKACKGKAQDDKKTGEKRYDVQPFPLYTLRHTCLTRWAPHMDPWTLAHLAGHRDMAITKRYIHPQADTYGGAAHSVTRSYDEYGQEAAAASGSAATSSPIYLIAQRDGAIQAAASYWMAGQTLHYVTLDRQEKQVALGSIDRALTQQLNRERRVSISLPPQ